jgi:hypothetical protein
MNNTNLGVALVTGDSGDTCFISLLTLIRLRFWSATMARIARFVVLLTREAGTQAEARGGRSN